MDEPATLALERPDQTDVIALIEALDAYQMPLYPAESHHGIPLDALLQPAVLFAVARDRTGAALGCGAIVLADGGLDGADDAEASPATGARAPEDGRWGEVKRMYLRPEARGRGLAARLLAFLEAQAAARGARTLALETGIRQPEAIALYRRAGYQPCPPFAGYAPDPLSVFLRKRLAGAEGSDGPSDCSIGGSIGGSAAAPAG